MKGFLASKISSKIDTIKRNKKEMTFVTILVDQTGVLVSFGVFPASNSDADFDPVPPQVSHFFVEPVIDVYPLVEGFDDKL